MPEKLGQQIREKTILGLCLLGVLLTACAPALSRATPTVSAYAQETPVFFSTHTPEPTSTVTPTASLPETAPTINTPEVNRGTFFERILSPIITDVAKKRLERSLNDPEYRQRIDWPLNEGRINILLFGYGDSHEPPVHKIQIASPTIISINTKTKQIDIGSFTHDLFDPYQARILGIEGRPLSAQRIDQLVLNPKIYNDPQKKFAVPQASLEYITGLSTDYQIHFADEAMGKFIDEVSGSLIVNLPVPMPYGGYWYQGKLYNEEGLVRNPGPNQLTGREAIGFIKAVSLYGPKDVKYDGRQEHNFRKWLLISALLKYLETNAGQKDLQAKTALFFSKEMISGAVATDFDIFPLLFNNLPQVMTALEKVPSREDSALGIYPIGNSFYGVDSCCVHNDFYQMEHQPIQWLTPLPQPGKEALLEQIKKGVFRTDIAYQVPRGGDPTGDLVAYWLSTRLLVRHHFQQK